MLNGVNLSLKQGQVLSILGPNGAGKSTLLDCMAGLQIPQQGRILLAGKDLHKELTTRDIADMVAYVPQVHIPAFGYTVLNFVIMGRAPKIGLFQKPRRVDEEAAWKALETLGITHLAKKPYTEISGGERQQVTIARAIAQSPKVILFDEPTAHLDYGNQHRILQLILSMEEKGYAVIITTHNPDHALLLGGMAAVLGRDGVLTMGESRSIITEERLKEVYAAELRLLYLDEVERTACVSPKLQKGADNAVQLV